MKSDFSIGSRGSSISIAICWHYHKNNNINTNTNTKFIDRCPSVALERGNYNVWGYLSSLQQKNLTPNRVFANSSQMISSKLIWGLERWLFMVSNQPKRSRIWVPYNFRAFMLDDREVCAYTIMPSLLPHA